MASSTLRSSRPRKGAVVVLFTGMMLFVVLPALGLAVDAGIWFTSKAKVQLAADGAALAAARAVRSSLGADAQKVAVSTARRFYRLNLNQDFPNILAADPVVTLTERGPASVAVRVAVHATAPTYLIHIFGAKTMDLNSEARLSAKH